MLILEAWRLALEAGVGGLFLVASAGKLKDRDGFAARVADYRLLPRWSVPVVARAIAVAELAVGAGLVFGAGRAPTIVAILLLSMFGGAVALNLLRGRTTISCGCFRGPGEQIGWPLVLQNFGLAVALIVASWGEPTHAPLMLRANAIAAGFVLVASWRIVAGLRPGHRPLSAGEPV